MNREQLEEKIQKEVQKNIGRALNRNALKCGLKAFASLFLIWMTRGMNAFPPYSMVYPWDLISILIYILLGLGIMLSFIPAYLSSNLEVNKLLKVE